MPLTTSFFFFFFFCFFCVFFLQICRQDIFKYPQNWLPQYGQIATLFYVLHSGSNSNGSPGSKFINFPSPIVALRVRGSVGVLHLRMGIRSELFISIQCARRGLAGVWYVQAWMPLRSRFSLPVSGRQQHGARIAIIAITTR
jgi:hypothetical protein